MDEVTLPRLSPERFDALLGPRAAEFADILDAARRTLAGRTLWHINSTARGGGVAEMLHSGLCYLVGAGLTTRWLVVDGNDAFFEVTKRLHFLLHGEPGDGGVLGEQERQVYEAALAPELQRVCSLVRGGDAVVLHDPQTLGLAPALRAAGAAVVWICHIGADEPNEHTRAAWRFLQRYVRATDVQSFSRRCYVWQGLDAAGVRIIPPCIDAFSPKNQDLDAATVAAVLDAAGIIPGARGGSPLFLRQDGSSGAVRRRATMVEGSPVPAGAPIVTQISRWDPLKDHPGVIRGFARHVPARTGAHLVLGGPDSDAVADDPTSAETWRQIRECWASLDPPDQARVHLACLPMDDLEENAAIVNALQRRADVVVQKSLAEGFGLTVTEAMWKGRPTAGSRVGGIQDQIVDGESGLLIDDPTDLAEVGHTITRLLDHRGPAAAMGRAARERVIERYLAPGLLSAYLGIIGHVLQPQPA